MKGDYLVKAIEEWVNRHPSPDEPSLPFLGGKKLCSPRELLGEIRKDTARGQRYRKRIIQLAVDVISEKFGPGIIMKTQSQRLTDSQKWQLTEDFRAYLAMKEELKKKYPEGSG